MGSDTKSAWAPLAQLQTIVAALALASCAKVPPPTRPPCTYYCAECGAHLVCPNTDCPVHGKAVSHGR